MSYLPITILAYLLNSIAVTIDKFLLVKSIPNPLTYVFYISVFSLLILFAFPFTLYPSPFTLYPLPFTLFLASVSTLLWTMGAYFMFAAIKKGEVDKVVPAIGTLIPLLLFAHAAFFSTITQTQLLSVGILIIGLVFLTFSSLRLKDVNLNLEILSAIFFALSYLILREAYLKENFLTVLVYSRFILIPPVLAFLLIPKLRRIILFSNSSNTHPAILNPQFIIGQAAGGTAQLLLTFAISLASPALVNSLQGIQYVFLFIFSLILAKKFPHIFGEKYSKLNLVFKILGISLVGLGLYLLTI